MIFVTVQGKKQQKKIRLSSILGNLSDVNVVCSLSSIDENFIVEIQTYSPHVVVVDFDTPVKVKMDFFDVLSLLNLENPGVKVVLVASETSVETFGHDEFYSKLQSSKIYDCIVSDDKELIAETIHNMISILTSGEKYRTLSSVSFKKENEETSSYVVDNSDEDKRETSSKSSEDISITASDVYSSKWYTFDNKRIETKTYLSNMMNSSQIVIGMMSFNESGFCLAFSLEMAHLLNIYGSVCVCSDDFFALKKYHSINDDSTSMSYNGVDIYSRGTSEDLSRYKFVVREMLSSEPAPADFYLLICSGYEWEFPDLQNYINNVQPEIEMNYIFTNIDKERFLNLSRIFQRSGRRVYRLEASQNPFEPCLWNIDTYFCILSKYMPIFKENKLMYKKKRQTSNILQWISLITVFSILIVSIVYICLFTKEIENGEYPSTEPTETANIVTTDPATEEEDNTLKFDLNDDGKVDVLDVGFLQLILSSGIDGIDEETGTDSGLDNTEPAEITESEKAEELTETTEAPSESTNPSEPESTAADTTMEVTQ